ncbi:MAG: type III pantothenate kinase [Gemmatimonadetes bacterium]|nr:type III pantothenate kinase [Gemmatimonadota bacterium]MBI3567473.1 type III pantothenate kinase [Gemmatimonadota bacterium]
MILCFDVGNTETTIGLCHGQDVQARWRVTTDPTRTPDEVYLLLVALLDAANVDLSAVQGSAIGSVVPAVTAPLAEACTRLGGLPPVIVDARSPLPITLDVDEPLTVGADRLINTLAASRLHQRDCIVVDLGTATTYDCITADGVFIGGVIAPGVQVSAESLFRRTSKLPATEIVAPKNVIGRRTEECIRSGVVLGSAEAIDGLVRRIKAAWPRPATPLVIGTGGLAAAFKPLCQELDVVEPDLTLQGLAMAHALLTA